MSVRNFIEKEIADKFALHNGAGAYRIQSVGDTYKAWVLREPGAYGVAIEYNDKVVSEKFANAYLESRTISLEEDGNLNILYLYCKDKALRNEFAKVCFDFCNPGKNGGLRYKIVHNPLEWWERWSALLGNSIKSKRVYDVLGELLVLCKLLSTEDKVNWSAISFGTHDIETLNALYEVKSTTRKYASEIHVSSQFQFDVEKELRLIFLRFEETNDGVSVDDVMRIISSLDPNKVSEYELYLEKHELQNGSQARYRRYKVLESRKYMIDDSFPRISATSFKDDKIPSRVKHIEYDVDLVGIDYENWSI